MNFKAFIIPGSRVDHMWRQQNRLGGVIHGTEFRASGFPLGRYEAIEIDLHYLDELQANVAVQVEVLGYEPSLPEPTSVEPTIESPEDFGTDESYDESSDGEQTEGDQTDKPRRSRKKVV